MRQAFSILLFAALLVGCSSNTLPDNKVSDSDIEEKQKEETKEQKVSRKSENKTAEYQPNPQVTDDRTLQTVGQTVEDEKGEATLKAYKKINETYNIGPIELTIKEAKVIHLRPDYSMIDYFHVLTHDEEFDFVKVFVEIENTSSENVNFAPVALLHTSLGETIDWEKDIYLEELNGVIEGNSVKSGNIGFIVNATDAETSNDEHNGEEKAHDETENQNSKNIEWIEITTSDVFNKEKKKISEFQKLKFVFN